MRKYGWMLMALLAFAACKHEEIPEKEPVPGEEKPNPVIPDISPIAHIIVNTENGVEVDSKDSKDYRTCTVTIEGGEDGPGLKEVPARIRGRGNSTWEWYPKKPYRIKLDESASVLGLAANKDWVLLADYRDVTHLMNATGFYLARELGLPHSNHIRFVTLTLNGEDLGLYALTEQVEEGGKRVQLNQEEGILLALDINDGPGDVPHATDNFWSEEFGMACAVKFPRDATAVQRDDVKEEFSLLEEAVASEDWEEIQKVLDVESMIHYIMIQEIIGNVEMDNNPSLRSGFIHRFDNKSKWVMGPLWDCDGGFSYNWGDMYDYSGRGHTFFENYRYLVFGSDPYYHAGAYGSTASDFFCCLFGVPEFVKAFQARWNEVHITLLEGLLDYLDETEELIGEAAQEDMDLWEINNYSHAAEYSKLVAWLTNRFNYLDGVIRNYPTHEGGPVVPTPSEDIEIKATLEYEASYAQDGHHEGTFVYISEADLETIEKALGISLETWGDRYESGQASFQAVEPDGTLNPDNTANAPGHWFNADGYVTGYNSDSYVFSEYNAWWQGFSLGKHPTICTPGTYEIAQAFVYGASAVCVRFHITVTEN